MNAIDDGTRLALDLLGAMGGGGWVGVVRRDGTGRNTRLEVPDTDQNLSPVPVDTRIPTQDKERNKAYTRIRNRMIIGLGTIPEVDTEMLKFEGAYTRIPTRHSKFHR